MCQNFIPLYGWIISHCMDIPCFVYPVTCPMNTWLISTVWLLRKALPGTFVSEDIFESLSSVLWGRDSAASLPHSPASLFISLCLAFGLFDVSWIVRDQPVVHMLLFELLIWAKNLSVQGPAFRAACQGPGRLCLQLPASSCLILSQNPALPHSHRVWSHCEAFLARKGKLLILGKCSNATV